MVNFVKKYSNNIHSQNGEDGIIEECLKRIGIASGISVEFGAPDKTFCSNTAALNWPLKYFFDIEEHEGIVKKTITPENVNELPDCNVMSIDIDGNDYAVWEAYKGTPDIVIIEINSSLKPMTEYFTSEKGSSFITMTNLGISKGYFLLCHTGNLIFLLNKYKELFPVNVNDIDLFNTAWL